MGNKVKSVFMMHYKGDGRAMYEPTKALVDSLGIPDKVKFVLLVVLIALLKLLPDDGEHWKLRLRTSSSAH